MEVSKPYCGVQNNPFMRVLAVVPARGGSKGVPDKNIRPLAGKPLLAYTAEQALRSRKLSRVLLSTDDPRIAKVGKAYGLEVPFSRPAELATDTAGSLPVVLHALQWVEEEEDRVYDAVMMLQPTTPFRRVTDIDKAIDLLEKTGADSVISVTEVGAFHPARMKYLEGDRLIDPPFCEAYENQPRQELPPMYIRSGDIYLTRRATLLNKSFKGSDCRALFIDASRAVNIDTLRDFVYAEFLIEKGLL